MNKLQRFQVAGLLLGLVIWAGSQAYANHPVYVEGNSGAGPGVTVVPPGSAGDFDGDGLIGTAEDTDNATDRVFGTINAALGSLNGAVNQNGRVVIVTSGRFPEVVLITGANGDVELEAAPGVDADIDAVLGGDGGNADRQGAPGIIVDSPSNRRVIIRNIVSRNWTKGILIRGSSNVIIDQCRVENNRDFGIHALDSVKVAITNSQVNNNGFRQGAGVDNTPQPGIGICFEKDTNGTVAFTTVTGNFAAGLSNKGGHSKRIDILHVVAFNNAPNFSGKFDDDD